MRSKNIALGSVVAFVLVGLFVILFASGALVTPKTVVQSRISATANFGLYSDSTCTQSLNSIDWGTVSPGGSASKTVYVKNLGNSRLVLSLWTENWNPTTANGPIAVNWNREGATLVAKQVVAAKLTLSVSSSASGFTAFSVDIGITGVARNRWV